MMITNKYIDPFTGFGFKRIFGTEENKHFLISFLNDLLDIDDNIIDIEYRNLEKLGLNILDRRAVFDVYCTDVKNNKFIVELQRSPQKDKIIEKAFNVAEFLALSKDEQFNYQRDLKARLDYKNVLSYAKEQAKEEGVKEGIREEKAKNKLKIVSNAYRLGLSVENIIKITGLSKLEVEQTLQEIKS